MFKLAMQDRWLVVVNTPELIEELRKLPDDQVSFIDAVHEVRSWMLQDFQGIDNKYVAFRL